jgi:hypothetical protein
LLVLAIISSIYCKVGASGKPGAVQYGNPDEYRVGEPEDTAESVITEISSENILEVVFAIFDREKSIELDKTEDETPRSEDRTE